MKNTIDVFSLNGNKYKYNYKYNLVVPSELYDEKKVERIARKYYHATKAISKEDFLYNKKFEKYRCLGLVLTDQCNFRCSYCANSSVYKYSKGYSSNSMSYDVINKALELYALGYKSGFKRDPNLRFSIMFYGGEPLLEFDKIKYIVKRVEEKYNIYDAIYTITTNGYLIDQEMIKFFKEKNFDVNISMDGYKDIHDLNRKTVAGDNTFDKVISNFYMLKDYLPDNRVGIITTFDTQVSPKKLYNFYKENPSVDRSLRRVASANTTNTDYYNTIEIYPKYDEEVNELYKLYNQGDDTNFIKRFYKDKFSNLFNKYEFRDITYSVCSPISAKLTVSTNGDLHICEKVNENYSIGNIKTGIDKNQAYAYYKNVVDIREQYCSNCKIRNICNVCFASLNRAGDCFTLEEGQCKQMKKISLRVLELYCTFLDNQTWPENPIFKNHDVIL